MSPTVKIKFDNEDGYALLDASAFDPDKHELYEESAPEAVADPAPVVTKFAKGK